LDEKCSFPVFYRIHPNATKWRPGRLGVNLTQNMQSNQWNPLSATVKTKSTLYQQQKQLKHEIQHKLKK
jgi:hypothetical protein